MGHGDGAEPDVLTRFGSERPTGQVDRSMGVAIVQCSEGKGKWPPRSRQPTKLKAVLATHPPSPRIHHLSFEARYNPEEKKLVASVVLTPSLATPDELEASGVLYVHPACHNTNKSQTLEAEPFGLMKPHSKTRRDGYFKS